MVKKTQTFTGIVRKDENTDFCINVDGVAGFTTAEDEGTIPTYVEDFLAAALGDEEHDSLEGSLKRTPLEILAEHVKLDGDGVVGYTLTHITHDDESDEPPSMQTEYHSTSDLG